MMSKEQEDQFPHGINNRPMPHDKTQVYLFGARIYTSRNLDDGRTQFSFGVLSFSREKDGEWYGVTTRQIFDFFEEEPATQNLLGKRAYWYKRTSGTKTDTQYGDSGITNLGELGFVVSYDNFFVKLQLHPDFVYSSEFTTDGFWSKILLAREGTNTS